MGVALADREVQRYAVKDYGGQRDNKLAKSLSNGFCVRAPEELAVSETVIRRMGIAK
jgi:hypothetical protein